MPALRYCWSVGVVPVRARSKSLAARSRAAGGRAEGVGEVDDWTESLVGGFVAVDVDMDGSWADEAADWP